MFKFPMTDSSGRMRVRKAATGRRRKRLETSRHALVPGSPRAKWTPPPRPPRSPATSGPPRRARFRRHSFFNKCYAFLNHEKIIQTSLKFWETTPHRCSCRPELRRGPRRKSPMRSLRRPICHRSSGRPRLIPMTVELRSMLLHQQSKWTEPVN